MTETTTTTDHTNPDLEPFMTAEEVCTWLHVRKSWLYDHVEKDAMPHVRIGAMLRFRRSELLTWMKDNTK